MKVISCLLLALFCCEAAVRGAQPGDAQKYAQDKFTCDDGKVIESALVNDDYCDCEDGTDEPGTSACANGHFFCANVGHKAALLPSSHVNDGVCDCCDGTDEHDGRTVCANDCLEQGRSALKETLESIKTMEAGIKLREEIIEQAKTAKAEKEEKLAAAKARYEQLHATWTERQAKKEEENKKEQDERSYRETQAEAKEVAAEMADELREELAEAQEAQEGGDKAEQPAEQAEPVEQQQQQQQEEAAAAPAEENFPYPKEYAAPPAADTAAAAAADPATEVGSEVEGQKEEEKKEEEQAAAFPYPAEYAYKEEKFEESEQEVPEEKPIEEAIEAVGEEENKPEEEKEEYVSPEAEEARRLFDEIDGDYQQAKREIEEIESWMAKDYGENREFLTLENQCVDVQQKQYTYEACPFGMAMQKEGGSRTSLGDWSGMEKDDSGKIRMKWTGGQGCWQGPSRSMSVTVECGTQNELTQIEEPSKCVYTGVLRTPAACTPALLEGLRASVPPEVLRQHSEL